MICDATIYAAGVGVSGVLSNLIKQRTACPLLMHLADIPIVPTNVCYWGKGGRGAAIVKVTLMTQPGTDQAASVKGKYATCLRVIMGDSIVPLFWHTLNCG